jgi:hypothetical protein
VQKAPRNTGCVAVSCCNAYSPGRWVVHYNKAPAAKHSPRRDAWVGLGCPDERRDAEHTGHRMVMLSEAVCLLSAGSRSFSKTKTRLFPLPFAFRSGTGRFRPNIFPDLSGTLQYRAKSTLFVCQRGLRAELLLQPAVRPIGWLSRFQTSQP